MTSPSPAPAGRPTDETEEAVEALDELCLDSLELPLGRLLANRDEFVKHHVSSRFLIVADTLAALSVLAARARDAEKALKRIAEQQPKTLAMIESNGFVFDSIGREPGNWQHLAFTIYVDLCEVDTIARALLAGRVGAEQDSDGG